MEKAALILFYAQNKPSKAYYQKLAEASSLPTRIQFATSWRMPCLRTLLHFKPQIAEDLYDIFYQEHTILNRRPPSVFKQKLFWLKTRWFYACDVNTIKSLQPKRIVLWNGLKYRRALFSRAAKAALEQPIPCIFMENGLLPDTTVCDPTGVNALNSMPRDTQFYQCLPDSKGTLPAELITRTSKHQKLASNKTLPERFIFIPFQVDTDTQILLFSSWIKNMRELFELLISIHEELKDIKFIFKEHPSSPVDYRNLHQQLPEEVGQFANDVSTQELIEKSLGVITINSTVGIESMLFNKPVITLGDAFYNIDQIVLNSSNKNALEQQLNALIRKPEESFNAELRHKFLHFLSQNYLIQGSWKKPTPEHISSMCERLEQLYNSPSNSLELTP